MKHTKKTALAALCRCLSVSIVFAMAISGCDSNAPNALRKSGDDLGANINAKQKENTLNEKTKQVQAKKVGVLIVSHGSRSKSWSKMLLDIEEAVRGELSESGRVDGVRSAFMEYIDPTIADQLKAFDAENYTNVILVPLLLTVSSHSFDDIPTIVGQKEDLMTLETLKSEGIEVYKPKADVTIAPLLDFPEVLGKNIVRRVGKMSEEPSEEGVVLVAYGSEPYEEEWAELLDRVASEVRDATGIDCVERCWCGHIVRYTGKPTEKTIKKVLDKKKRALVIPVLVAVDENFQGRIIGGAVKNVGADDRIAYRHDAILPDENVNKWVIDISLELAAKIAGADKEADEVFQAGEDKEASSRPKTKSLFARSLTTNERSHGMYQ